MHETTHSVLAANVRRLRNAKGLSRERLAVTADVAARTVASIELETGNPSLSVLSAIAAVLGVDVAELVADPTAELDPRSSAVAGGAA